MRTATGTGTGATTLPLPSGNRQPFDTDGQLARSAAFIQAPDATAADGRYSPARTTDLPY
ncbi:MAG: hypothetical protein HC888_12035 [Candidatus Competibacteraceae bacterium]|nr:hypothetical protein [Candidatus Competibacteraceae bacterium]